MSGSTRAKTKNNKEAFLFDLQVKYICENGKTNQFQKDTKKFDVKFLILQFMDVNFHGRYIMTTIK